MAARSEHPKFDYGDTVRVLSGEREGRLGAVVGINETEVSRTYTIEFGDGTDCEFPEHFLSKYDGASV